MSNPETNKKRAVVFYLLIIFIAAIVLILVSMFVRMRTMQDEFDTEQSEAESSYAAQEAEISESISAENVEMQNALTQMERKAHAAELLLLAQKACYEGNIRDFQGYMASLEGFTDALSAESLEIYDELVNKLRG